jgi:hypothetical protein
MQDFFRCEDGYEASADVVSPRAIRSSSWTCTEWDETHNASRERRLMMQGHLVHLAKGYSLPSVT